MDKTNATLLNAKLVDIVDTFRCGDDDNNTMLDLLTALSITATFRTTSTPYDFHEAWKIAHRAVYFETCNNDLEAIRVALSEAGAALVTRFNVPASAGEDSRESLVNEIMNELDRR